MAAIRRFCAELCQDYEHGLDEEARLERARALAKTVGVELPDEVVPWVWYCRACCRDLLVCWWPGREHGEAPPEQLLELLELGEDGRWMETCPHCNERQNVHWRPRRGRARG